MTFRQLRNYLHNHGPQGVLWLESNIVERAEVTENGAVRITNLFSKQSYILPRKYTELKLRILDKKDWIFLGQFTTKKAER